MARKTKKAYYFDFKSLLLALGIDQTQLSEDLGMKKPQISRWLNEGGRNMSLKSIETICNHYQIDPNDFMRWETTQTWEKDQLTKLKR